MLWGDVYNMTAMWLSGRVAAVAPERVGIIASKRVEIITSDRVASRG